MSNTTTNHDPTSAPTPTQANPPPSDSTSGSTSNPPSNPPSNSNLDSNSTLEKETTAIDALLAHYLALLDEYTALRDTLHTLQSRMFHDLARANFAAERGVRRYGRDYYDGRMQAGRRVRVCDSTGGEGGVKGDGEGGGLQGDGDGEGVSLEGGKEGVVFHVAAYPSPPGRGEGGKEAGDGSGAEPSVVVGDEDRNEDGKEKQPEKDGSTAAPGNGESEKEIVKPVDPLRWFGILTPLPLRQAQGHAIKAVEEIIPRLATLSTAMAAVELEVRRARKKRAKAEKAEEKKLVALEEKMAEVDVNA